MALFDTVHRTGTGCSKWDGLEAKFGDENILPLWVADMDFEVPEAVQEAIVERTKHPVYGYARYTETFYACIVAWYADRFDWQIEEEWIVPEHGVMISVNLAIEAFTKEGEGVLVQTPVYPPFLSSVENHGRSVLENRLLFDAGNTTIDFEDFETKAKEASLFLLCSPHNPSTRSWNTEELRRMVEICHRHDVCIVSDEIHSDLVLGGRHLPTAALEKAKEITLVLHAPSKSFNIAGLNTSYVIIPNRQLRERYIVAHKKAGLGNGNVCGLVALEAAYAHGAPWLEALKAHLAANSTFVKQYIWDYIPEITVFRHDATFLMWLDCRGLRMDDEALSRFFIQETKLGLNSGIGFGEAGSGFMRLNIGTGRDMLEKAMQQLERAVKQRRG